MLVDRSKHMLSVISSIHSNPKCACSNRSIKGLGVRASDLHLCQKGFHVCCSRAWYDRRTDPGFLLCPSRAGLAILTKCSACSMISGQWQLRMCVCVCMCQFCSIECGIFLRTNAFRTRMLCVPTEIAHTATPRLAASPNTHIWKWAHVCCMARVGWIGWLRQPPHGHPLSGRNTHACMCTYVR